MAESDVFECSTDDVISVKSSYFLDKFQCMKSRAPSSVSCYNSRKDEGNAYHLQMNTNNVGCVVSLKTRIISSSINN